MLMNWILVIVSLAAVALFVWAISPAGDEFFWDRAEARDLAYVRDHPDCSWEEAHRHRERWHRRHGG